MIDLYKIQRLPQRQDSVAEQLVDLQMIANKMGMYDAADVISQWCKNLPHVEYGCHCDLEPGMEPDGCVIDEGRLNDCIYAEPNMRKEQCEYWKIKTT